MRLDQLERLGRAFRLAVDPEVVQPKEPAQKDPSFLVTRHDYG